MLLPEMSTPPPALVANKQESATKIHKTTKFMCLLRILWLFHRHNRETTHSRAGYFIAINHQSSALRLPMRKPLDATSDER
jgi:hypothetical protein